MSASPTNNQRLVFGSLVFTLSALCLLINLVGMARLAYDVVVLGAPTDLLVKAVILALVYVFGLGLGTISHRRFDSLAFAQFATVYAWVYLALTCLTYLGVTFRISLHDYSVLLYGAFFLLILLELAAVLALRLFIPGKAIGIFAIPMIAIVLFHLGLVVYQYIFAGTPVTAYLLGDLVFLLAMTGVSSALLGESAFRSLMERVIERVG
jgi:hypothetical protein